MAEHLQGIAGEERAVTRRVLLGLVGTASVMALANGRASAQDAKKGTVRTFVGESIKGSFEDALADALKKLNKVLNEGNVADALATWKIVEVTGIELGGVGNLRRVDTVALHGSSHHTCR